MRPNFQRYPYGDASRGIRGDCMRTCIASLLDLSTDEVPHFLKDDSDDWLKNLNAWLAPLKRAYLVLPVPDADAVPCVFALQGLDLYHLMGVRTANGSFHQIVGRSGRPCWCPILGDVEGREYDVIEIGFLTVTSL